MGAVCAQTRSYDGFGNNEANPHFGAVGSELRYMTPRSFADGIGSPSGPDRPNPRDVSNVLFAQPDYIYDEHELSDFVWVFGQFIDHDITLVEESHTNPGINVINIAIKSFQYLSICWLLADLCIGSYLPYPEHIAKTVIIHQSSLSSTVNVDGSQIQAKPDSWRSEKEITYIVDDIDPWVGMLAEEHMPDAIFGETIMTIMKDQFRALRDGDRFYYLIDPALSANEVLEVRNTTLAKIIQRNTGIQALQKNVFRMQRSCHDLEIEERHLEMLIFPNPVLHDYDLTLFSFSEGDANLTIRNMLGQIIEQQTLPLEKGVNSFKSSLRSGLPVGHYTFEVQMEHEAETIKVFKRD